MKLKENKKGQSLSNKTWAMVQDVASNEKKANGSLLFISKNMFDLFREGKMPINQYFGEKINDADPMNMFFNSDGTRNSVSGCRAWWKFRFFFMETFFAS